MEGRILISNLHNTDAEVQQKATNYFTSSREAEEAVARYEQVKYAVDTSLPLKQAAYEQMVQSLKKARERQS